MNYFAHGRHHLNDPYFLAGVSVPDWLSVVDRKVRARSARARPFENSANPHEASVARGIIRHHEEDDWFHRTRAFSELSWRFTVAIREILPPDDGFRPSFLGHILVELLLDDVLIQQEPAKLDEYYRVMDGLDAVAVAELVNRMTNKPAVRLAEFIGLFSKERFLYDYAEDAKLLMRLNHVMRRVKLPALPEAVRDFFPTARFEVKARWSELLDPAGAVPHS